MATSHAELKRRVLAAVKELPEDALAEVAMFLDYQRYRHRKRGANAPPYQPVALGGLWKGIQVTDEDIEAARSDMWDRWTDRAP